MIEKKTYKDTLEAVKKLADVAQHLPKAVKECKDVVADFKKLEQAIASMKSPKNFVFHVTKDIIVNHTQIYQDMENLVNDYKKKNFYDFGLNLGNALYKILLGAKVIEISPVEAFDIDFVQGIQWPWSGKTKKAEEEIKITGKVILGLLVGFGEGVTDSVDQCI